MDAITEILLILGFIFIGIPFITYLLVEKKKYKNLSRNQRYAGFWLRFLAGFIDTVTLTLLYLFIERLFGIDPEPWRSYSSNPTLYWLFLFSQIIIPWFYFCGLQSSKDQGTVGMQLFKIKIYDEQLKRVKFWRLTGRYIASITSWFLFLVGYFMIGWTSRKQGFHDFCARTIHLVHK
jgi:uncharacterized RDD family membrane protein YckC